MVNTETIKIIGKLSRLTGRSKKSIHPLSTETKEQMYSLLYDDSIPLHGVGCVKLGDTTKLLGKLNRLAERSKSGIYPFSTATKEQKNGLLYDDSKTCADVHPLVTDCIIDDADDDIVIGVKVEDDDAYVSVTSRNDPELSIVIENGVWYQA